MKPQVKTPEFAKLAKKHIFDPLEELELKDAVQARKKEVTISDRTFRIDYHGDEVFLHPKVGFVPCGWFEIKRIGEFDE